MPHHTMCGQSLPPGAECKLLNSNCNHYTPPPTHLLQALDTCPPVKGNVEKVDAWHVSMLLEQMAQQQGIEKLLL